jgi:hypothetical protein
MSKFRSIVLFVILAALIGCAVKFGIWWWTNREWKDIQSRQMAAISSLADVPPEGWFRFDWEEEVITLYNAWGNVTFTSEYSGLSNTEMRLLAIELEGIVSKATPANCFEKVDQIFVLMLRFSKSPEFVSRNREYFHDMERRTLDRIRAEGP